MSEVTPQQTFDLVISGGGATGWSLLLSLQTMLPADKPLKVAFIDSFDPNKAQPHPGFDARALALSKQTLQFFKTMGIADDIAKRGTAIKTIQVSDKGAAGQVRLHHSDYHETELGMVMEAQDLGAVLLECAERNLQEQALSHIELVRLQPDKIQLAETRRDSIQITTESGHRLTTQLLVLAEGTQSSSKAFFNIDVTQKNYQQHAIIANVVTELPPNNTAFERFTASGPLAFLPMTEQRSGVVWSVASADVEQLLALDDDNFIQQLQTQFGQRLGKIIKVGKRQSYPLNLLKSDDSFSHRVVCIGNAAQTLHPIAGQGFNLALRDAWQLAKCIANTVQQKQDIGAYQSLCQFKAERKQDQQQTILLTDSLVHLFSNNNALLRAGRNIGLLLMNNKQKLKDGFARIAMGQRSGAQL
ncbi:2-octaprenyl-6-methoxyphenyl hydroxylase [Planctobacterium marinum]|uniref:2-octaprenyl-6-methoxyphenyl hydroxylase n=1 Tax=Planctobacterium marinum TaxID=1631968 RepID=A0AA48HLP7_9ALTE|nr:2-octaprenyl-6-methoxyphenyl hydroxylase [Planctobacterium marinum]